MRRLLSSAALLAAAAFPVLADERMEHAEWVSEFHEGTGEASTKESGMTNFGMQCSEDGCRFFYSNGINCEPGTTYPVVIATSAGSIAVETVCAPVATADGETGRYWFNDSPQFNDALMQSDTVGIAFPLANGQFKISQFLMNGYGEAVERVMSGLRARKAEREAREAAEREQRAREAAERARKAQEAAERARQAAEKAAAERARQAAEKAAAERARIAAEQEAARKAVETEAVPAPETPVADKAVAAEEKPPVDPKPSVEEKPAVAEKSPAEQMPAAEDKSPAEPASTPPNEAANTEQGAEQGASADAADTSSPAGSAEMNAGEADDVSPESSSETDTAPAQPQSPRGNRLPARL